MLQTISALRRARCQHLARPARVRRVPSRRPPTLGLDGLVRLQRLNHPRHCQTMLHQQRNAALQASEPQSCVETRQLQRLRLWRMRTGRTRTVPLKKKLMTRSAPSLLHPHPRHHRRKWAICWPSAIAVLHGLQAAGARHERTHLYPMVFRLLVSARRATRPPCCPPDRARHRHWQLSQAVLGVTLRLQRVASLAARAALCRCQGRGLDCQQLSPPRPPDVGRYVVDLERRVTVETQKKNNR